MAEARAIRAQRQGGAGPVVACQNLSKVFKDFWMRDRARAVDGVTFEINPHEVFGLLGPNGSGKSTTIKMMLGLLRPTSGRLVVFGKAPSDVSTKKRIGYLPEESYLYPFLNARETLDYYAKLFELDRRTRTKRIDELLDMVGLTANQFRPVKEYSKGMQRRIGLAQALINDPDLLILDEPTTGLDPIGTRQVKDLIIELGRRGKTVLLSSHLLADVEDCVDRMVILYGGRIRAEGAADELLSAADRTAIETDTLDDETIAEIDEVIRRRTRGEAALRSVSKPRQSLEALFLDIVEKAQSERLSTSGATAGGATAAFLAGAGVDEGDALIDRLVDADIAEPDASDPAPEPVLPPEAKAKMPEVVPAEPTAPADVAPPVAEDDMLEAMVQRMEAQAVTGEPQPTPDPAPPPPPPPPSAPPPVSDEGVDEALIDALLDDPDTERNP